MAKKDFKAAIKNKTNLGSKQGIGAVFSSTEEKEVTPVAQVTLEEKEEKEEDIKEPKNLRQSFIIQDDYLDKLKNFVYFNKANNDPLYNQKEALHEALDLLFETIETIPERPKAVKLAEQKRSGKIKKGLK